MSCPAALIFLLLAVDAGPSASAPELQPLSFRGRADPDRVRLGEPFSYELEIRHSLSQRYDLRPPANDGAFELLGQTRSRVDGQDSATTTFVLRLALFELGRRKLPDLTFEVIEGERSGRFVAPGIPVEGIGSLPPDAEKGEQLRDIKPPEAVPIRSYRLLAALTVLLAAALAGYGAYRWLKRRRLRPPIERPLAALDVRTFAALDALRRENLPAQGRAREFYFRLSEIARAYLGERYGFEALECTSAELLEAARQHRSRGLPAEELERFVAESDLVKFAKAPASEAQCNEALEFVGQLVRRTATTPNQASSAELNRAVGAERSHVDELRLS